MPSLVLIVEDEMILARNVKTFLERRGYDVILAENIRTASRLYAESQPDALLIDQNLPDGIGLHLVKTIRAKDKTTKLVMITAHGKVETAVEAMKSGADDSLLKPVSLAEIGIVVDKLLEQARLVHSLSYFQSKEKQRSGVDRILGTSPAIEAMKARL